MKIYLAAGHGGYELKQKIADFLIKKKYEVEDLGSFVLDPGDDYPIYADKIAEKIKQDRNARGIALCGSGVGMSIAINRNKGVRAVLANSCELAKLSRLHNNAQVLVLGKRTKFMDPWQEIVEIFLKTQLDSSPRYARRIKMMD